MATSKPPKQPPFPHPPLEQGVAQYPTPVVPNYNDKKGGWGLSDQGHIVLVERVSIEKGNFNPQPLDGTVIYTGRDANKWPSTLYLVAEKPTPDGEFIYRFWANDRSLASQDPWNYGIKYDAGDPNFPEYIRDYIVPRSQYAPADIGTKDPVFGAGQPITLAVNNTTHIATVSGTGFNLTIGSAITIYSTTAQTNSLLGPFTLLATPPPTSTRLYFTAPAGASVPTGSLFINPTVISEQEMSPLPEDNPLRSRYVAVRRIYEPIPGAVLITNENKPGLMGIIQKNDQLVTAQTQPNSLSLDTADGSVLESTVEHVSAAKSNLTTIYTTGPYELDGNLYDDFSQLNLVHRELIVPAGTAALTDASSGYGGGANGYLLSARDEPIDASKTKRTIVSVASLPPSRIEYRTGTYTTPTLIKGLNIQGYNLSCGATTDIRVVVQPVSRASQTKPTTFKTVTSYSYGAPTTTGDCYLFSPVLQQLAYTGLFVNFDLGGVLNDPIDSTTTPNTKICYSCTSGGASQGCENIKFDASSPFSATDYITLINGGTVQKTIGQTSGTLCPATLTTFTGPYVPISWDSKYWKA